MKVLVACNTLTSIAQAAYWDHARFFYRLGKDYPKADFYQYFARRMSIDRFRNTAAEFALKLGTDYLMFIDDDMMLPCDTFTKLKAANLDLAAALNYIRGYPYEIMAFRSVEKHSRLEALQPEDITGGVIKCDAIGTAVCLIKTKVFKRTPAPWFVTGVHGTEDIYFCMRARQADKRTTIGVHTGVVTGHLLDPIPINQFSREALIKFDESMMDPEILKQVKLDEAAKNGDRGEAYVEENIEPGMRAEPTEVNP